MQPYQHVREAIPVNPCEAHTQSAACTLPEDTAHRHEPHPPIKTSTPLDISICFWSECFPNSTSSTSPHMCTSCSCRSSSSMMPKGRLRPWPFLYTYTHRSSSRDLGTALGFVFALRTDTPRSRRQPWLSKSLTNSKSAAECLESAFSQRQY